LGFKKTKTILFSLDAKQDYLVVFFTVLGNTIRARLFVSGHYMNMKGAGKKT